MVFPLSFLFYLPCCSLVEDDIIQLFFAFHGNGTLQEF
jgi:hypothetical protein